MTNVEQIAQRRIREFLASEYKEESQGKLQHLFNQAKLGHYYVKEQQIAQRIGNGQVIRIIGLVATDKEEIRRQIEHSLPEIKLA